MKIKTGPGSRKDNHMVQLLPYNEQEGKLSLNDWIYLYQEEYKTFLNAGTIRKRRAVAGLGVMVPPRTYLLSKEEFEKVLATPLPFCSNVVR